MSLLTVASLTASLVASNLSSTVVLLLIGAISSIILPFRVGALFFLSFLSGPRVYFCPVGGFISGGIIVGFVDGGRMIKGIIIEAIEASGAAGAVGNMGTVM